MSEYRYIFGNIGGNEVVGPTPFHDEKGYSVLSYVANFFEKVANDNNENANDNIRSLLTLPIKGAVGRNDEIEWLKTINRCRYIFEEAEVSGPSYPSSLDDYPFIEDFERRIESTANDNNNFIADTRA